MAEQQLEQIEGTVEDIIYEKQSCGSLFDAWLFGGRGGMWHFDVFRCTG